MAGPMMKKNFEIQKLYQEREANLRMNKKIAANTEWYSKQAAKDEMYAQKLQERKSQEQRVEAKAKSTKERREKLRDLIAEDTETYRSELRAKGLALAV